MHHAFLDHLGSVADDYVSGDSVQRRVLKFLEKGHTWMEAESVHSAIEGKLRGRQIIWPAEYIDVITAARRDHPYEVKQVDHTFFRDFSKLNF